MDTIQEQKLRFYVRVAGYALLAVLVLGTFWQVRHIWPPFFVAFVMAIARVPYEVLGASSRTKVRAPFWESGIELRLHPPEKKSNSIDRTLSSLASADV